MLPAVEQAPPHRHRVPQRLPAKAGAAWRAAEDGPRGRDRHVRAQDAPGRCQQACPAWNTGKPLNPKTFIMGIRELSVEAEHGIDLIPNSPIVRETYGLDDTRPAAAALARPIVDEAIPYDAVWDCVTCGACVEACPVLIEHVDKIVGLRRNLVLEESRFPAELTTAFRAMENQGNPWGQPAGERTAWTRGLAFDVPVVADVAAAGRLDELEILYWVGCAAAFDPRNQKVARAVATCLHAAGVEFAILGQEESCTGDPARRMGNDYVYQILAAGNVETLNRYGM
ncbi:MAG: (Fe-S)-binding protein, partial [Chloroflexi bacterium]|nr:(Fe-S)-binding protein [Chloroflexota bacterium]